MVKTPPKVFWGGFAGLNPFLKVCLRVFGMFKVFKDFKGSTVTCCTLRP